MADREMSVKLTTEGFTQARVAAKSVEQALGNVGGAVSRMAGAFAQVTGISALVAGLGGGLGLGALVKSGLQASDAMANMKISFETLLGTKPKADAFVNTLQNMANVTPFDTTNLAEASRVMLAMGFSAQQTEQMLWRLGDATAAAGRGPEFIKDIGYIFGQIKSAGALRTEDFNQISTTGLMGYDEMAKKLGFNTAAEFRKAMEKGTITSSEAINVMMAKFESTFSGTMNKMAGTLSGLTSTLGDTWNSALRDIGTAFTPIAEGVLRGVTGALQGLVDSGWFGKVANDMSNLIDPAVVAKGMAKGMAFIKTVFENMPKAFSGVMEVMKALPGALVAVFEAVSQRDFWGAAAGTFWEGVKKAGLGIFGIISGAFVGVVDWIGNRILDIIDLIPGMKKHTAPLREQVDGTRWYNRLTAAWDEATLEGKKSRNALAPLMADPRMQALTVAGSKVGDAYKAGVADYDKNYNELYGYITKAMNAPPATPTPPPFEPFKNDTPSIAANTFKIAQNTGKMNDKLSKYAMGGGDIGEVLTPARMYSGANAKQRVESAADSFVEIVVQRMMLQNNWAGSH